MLNFSFAQTAAQNYKNNRRLSTQKRVTGKATLYSIARPDQIT
jgi:hypothetical protein